MTTYPSMSHVYIFIILGPEMAAPVCYFPTGNFCYNFRVAGPLCVRLCRTRACCTHRVWIPCGAPQASSIDAPRLMSPSNVQCESRLPGWDAARDLLTLDFPPSRMPPGASNPELDWQLPQAGLLLTRAPHTCAPYLGQVRCSPLCRTSSWLLTPSHV